MYIFTVVTAMVWIWLCLCTGSHVWKLHPRVKALEGEWTFQSGAEWDSPRVGEVCALVFVFFSFPQSHGNSFWATTRMTGSLKSAELSKRK